MWPWGKKTTQPDPLVSQSLGGAHVATTEEIARAGLFSDRGIRIGYARSETNGWGPVLRYPGDAHLITVAPSGTGKGRDVLIPAMLEYPHSCIVIDPKGQLAAVTGPYRAAPKEQGGMGQRVIVLNPFNILSQFLPRSHQFNPLGALDPALDSFGMDCDNIADAIVVHDPGRDNHWNESAHGLIAALIGHLVANAPPDLRTLDYIRTLVRRMDLLQEQARIAINGNDPMAAEALDGFTDLTTASNRGELASIISTARTQTRFLGTRAIADSLSGRESNFRFRELKQRPTTVYLTLPTRYLATGSKWFRLVVAAALDDLLREEKGEPVLVIADEFYQLGRLKILQNAMSLARGYGLQLWPVLQDLGQLKEHYAESWETFLANAEVRQFFAPRDKTTAEYLSALTGVYTEVTASRSAGTSGHPALFADRSVQAGVSFNQTQRPLLLPHELMGLGPSEALIFGPRNTVISALRRAYQKTELAKHAAPDPYHLA
jgi:type IV secretion system protein VirD4